MSPSVEKIKQDLDILIRARYPVIFCVSYEESRVSHLLGEIAAQRGAEVYVWSRTKGFVSLSGKVIEAVLAPEKALQFIEEHKNKTTFLLKDFHPYLKEPAVVRKLRDLCHELKLSKKNIVLVSPMMTVPTELSKEVAVLDFPLPSREDIVEIYEKIPEALGLELEGDETHRDQCVEAAIGLTQEEIENVFAKSIVKHGSINVTEILVEKRQIVQKAGILDFIPVSGDFDSIGGVSNLKDWLRKRKAGFSKEARQINLPSPKGVLMVGLPGCGKSLTAICTGAAWQMPLLRLDMGKVFSGLVGSSETNMRQALQTAEAVSPCILWIDEIEKGMAGAGGGGGDSGTTQRVFGTFLTWMQEKKMPVFVLATANDISGLPPEMLRKGRFDEIFYVDLPKDNERSSILKIHLEKRGWEIVDFDEGEFRQATLDFSGAEIEQVLIDARYDAFFHEQNLSMKHLIAAAKRTVPLAKTMKERIDAIRSWAKSRAVAASGLDEEEQVLKSRTLEMEAN